MNTKLFILLLLTFNISYGQQMNCDSVCIVGIIETQNKAQNIHGDNSQTNNNSQPYSNTLNCNKYQGQYGIAIGAVGTFILTKEGNPRNSNYGKVISYDTSNCTGQNGVWTWNGWDGGHGAECIYTPALVNKGTCNPIGQQCMFKDDMTTRKGTYECK